MDLDDVRWFIIYFDRWHGRTEWVEYDDQDKAFREYLEAEKRPESKGPDPQLEIVMVGAESIESVQRAYPHYFASGDRETRLQEIAESLLFA